MAAIAIGPQLMAAEADALCAAGYDERSGERTNRRNGYRSREFDTAAETLGGVPVHTSSWLDR